MKTKATTCITRLPGVLFLTALLAVGACTSEIADEGIPPTEVDADRREVLLTFKNKLALSGGTTRGIATTAENQLTALDVYVFGSETEGGTYTFQECFSYRGEEAGAIPSKSTPLPLAVDMADDSKTTGLLGLKKGLFVKLYCVANTPGLIDPATGNTLTASDFTGLKLKESAVSAAPAVQTPGVPTEDDFLSYHTPLLTADVATDILVTPLAMSGAYTTPIDLTDPAGASRLNIGFKLTRMATRFDIVNNAAESKFTIQSISMGKGRRGATFFPIAVCDAQTSVQPDKVITYPARPFDGVQANLGLQEGAFYTYASPLADAGYLILKGLYKVNASEEQEVSYQVPFRQLGADGKETYLEIQHNHRYTIGITKADNNRLDFSLKVEEWADDGSITDYTPETKPGEVTLGNKDADTYYEEDLVSKKHTVKMSLLAGSNFTATATAMLQVTKTYAGGQAGQQYDWLQIETPPSTFAGDQNAPIAYAYNFTTTSDYKKGRYPRATVRFFDPISGNESILYVEAIAAPTPDEANQPAKAPNGSSENPNSVDLEQVVVSLYRITGSQVNLTISCADEVELESNPNWLTVTKTGTQLPQTTYSLVLNNRDVVDVSGMVVFHNKNKEALKTEYTINLLDAPVLPTFESIGTGNTFTPDEANAATLGDLAMNIAPSNTAAVVTIPMDGVTTQIDFNGGPEWLKSDATAVTRTAATRAVTAQQQVVTFSLQEGKLAGAKTATITLVNKIGGKNEVFTISPKLNVGTLEKVSSIPTQNALSGTNMTLYKMPAGESEMKLKVTSYGGSMLTTDNDHVTVTKTPATRASSVTQDEVVSYYTLTANAVGTTQLTLANRTDPTKQTVYTLTVKSTAITSADATVAAVNNATNSIQIDSPEGCTATVTNWNGSGKAWFTISNATLGIGSQTLRIAQLDNTTNIMRPATVLLTNNIVGGESKTITITPSFAAPTFSRTTIRMENVTKSYNNRNGLSGTDRTTFTIAGAGGWEYTGVSNASSINVSTSGNTVTIAGKKKGTSTINFRNKSDQSKTSSVSVTVARSFAGQPVWEINGYYIAKTDAGNSNWNALHHNICEAGADGDGGNTSGSNINRGKWFIPFDWDLTTILNSSGIGNAPQAVYNFLVTDNKVFVHGWDYWTYSEYGKKNAYTLFVDPGYVIRGSSRVRTDGLACRCVIK